MADRESDHPAEPEAGAFHWPSSARTRRTGEADALEDAPATPTPPAWAPAYGGARGLPDAGRPGGPGDGSPAMRPPPAFGATTAPGGQGEALRPADAPAWETADRRIAGGQSRPEGVAGSDSPQDEDAAWAPPGAVGWPWESAAGVAYPAREPEPGKDVGWSAAYQPPSSPAKPADGFGSAGDDGSADGFGSAWDDGSAVGYGLTEDYESAVGCEPAGEHDLAGGYGSAYLSPGYSAGGLAADLLMPGRRRPSPAGWRRAVHQATGGLVRPSESAARRRERELLQRVRAPVAAGHHRVAVLSLKGGVGKTTTVMGLGLTLAALRGDRVIALDANPDRGTLCDKLRLETSATVRDLVSERQQIQRYADVRAYTTEAAGRLEVLASDRDPTVSVAFGAEDYRKAAEVLERYYSICVTDCGTGLLHSAMAGVLALTDQIVLVSTPSVDGARSASATLDWLAAHGYGALARTAVVALSMIRRRSRTSVDLDLLERHFAARCRSVVRVPHDPHLEEGAEMDLAELQRPTLDAYLALAAEVADGFARTA